MAERSKGVVKWFSAEKGYGFIAPDGGGKDVFVHVSAVEKSGLSGLDTGERVSFQLIESKGKQSSGKQSAGFIK